MDKKKRIKILTTVIPMMLIGATVGFMAASYKMDAAKTTPTSHVIALILFFIPAFLLVVAAHEAGHAIASSWVNFDFRMYVVGPFMWDKEETGWTFKWNKNVNISGGMVICLPTTTENLAKRFSIYALGGPVSSLVFTAFSYGVYLLIPIINSNDNPGLKLIESLFGLISFLSLLIFIITLVPLHTGGFYTDGARALRFLRGGDTARFELLLMKIITSSSGGVRPRLLSLEEINEALALAKKINAPMKVYVHYFLYHYAFDEDDFDEAEGHLKDYLAEIESIPRGMRGSVFLEASFFYAFARKHLAQAELYWKQYVPSAIIAKAQLFATEAAMYNLKDDEASLNAKIELAIKELPNMMDRGLAVSMRERLHSLKRLAYSEDRIPEMDK